MVVRITILRASGPSSALVMFVGLLTTISLLLPLGLPLSRAPQHVPLFLAPAPFSASLRACPNCDRLRVRRTQTKRGQPKLTGPFWQATVTIW